jgi:hypothetical protein
MVTTDRKMAGICPFCPVWRPGMGYEEGGDREISAFQLLQGGKIP